MAFLAGDPITSTRLNRLQPAAYYAAASSTVAASQTDAAVPGCSITFSTAAANALVQVSWSVSFYSATTAPTTFGSARAFIDGTGAPVFAMGDSRTANDKRTVAQFYDTTLAAAGSHTIVLRVTTPANMTVAQYTALRVTVFEVV